MIQNLFIPRQQNNFQPILLRKIALVFYSILLLLVNYTPLFSGNTFSSASASSISTVNIINLTNKDRQKFGLPELRQNLELNTAAYNKANDMFNKQYWDHFGPSGETPWQFITSSGYEYVYAGENLAKGFQTSEGVVQAWMASPTHRENILSPNYQEIGVAVVSGNFNGEKTTIVVQMFGNKTSEIAKVNQNVRSIDEGSAVIVREEGLIKAIKFMAPKEGEVLTNSLISVQGGAELSAQDIQYQLSLKLNDSELTRITSSSSSWSFEESRSYPEGKNTLSVKLLSENGVNVESENLSHTINFIIDSTAPIIKVDNLKFSISNSDQIRGIINLGEKDAQLKLVIDNAEYGFTYDEKSSYYIIYFSVNENFQKATLFAADKYGNIAQEDVTGKLQTFISREYSENSENQQVAGVTSTTIGGLPFGLGFIQNFQVSDWINLGIALFVLTLLIIEIEYYRREGRIAERYHSVLFIVIWITSVFLAFIGNLTGRVI